MAEDPLTEEELDLMFSVEGQYPPGTIITDKMREEFAAILAAAARIADPELSALEAEVVGLDDPGPGADVVRRV
jgi:hypothetical protein